MEYGLGREKDAGPVDTGSSCDPLFAFACNSSIFNVLQELSRSARAPWKCWSLQTPIDTHKFDSRSRLSAKLAIFGFPSKEKVHVR